LSRCHASPGVTGVNEVRFDESEMEEERAIAMIEEAEGLL